MSGCMLFDSACWIRQCLRSQYLSPLYPIFSGNMHIFVRFFTAHMWRSQEFYLPKHHSMYCSMQNLGYIAMLAMMEYKCCVIRTPSCNYNDHGEQSHAAEWHRLMVIFVYAFDLVKPPLVPCMQRSLLNKKIWSDQKPSCFPLPSQRS